MRLTHISDSGHILIGLQLFVVWNRTCLVRLSAPCLPAAPTSSRHKLYTPLDFIPRAGLPGAQQAAVFQPAARGTRKVVVATNIAGGWCCNLFLLRVYVCMGA